MFVIGITGGIGCGKSTAASVCKKAGLPVIDADDLSRKATAADGAAIPEIKETFGTSVIDQDGSLNRTAMAKRVFNDHRALDQLSHIIHSHVLRVMREQVDALREKKAKAVVLDVPIPVREGFVDLCDQIWVVWASEENRLSRLSERGMTEEEARRRMAMQMTKDEYVALADHVIENDHSLSAFEQTVRALMEQELGQRGIRFKKETPSLEETASGDETVMSDDTSGQQDKQINQA